MEGTIRNIRRYPVKGLSGDEMTEVQLSPGQALPDDRRFAIAHGSTGFDPDQPEWLPKTHFIMLMRNERLAALETRYDADNTTLSVLRDAKPVARGDLTDPMGRAIIEDFFNAYMKNERRAPLKIVDAPGHVFSDHRNPVVSLMNLASVRDLERVVGRAIDASRFRANIIFDNKQPWSEFEWIDREVVIGGARLKITYRTERCAAVNVDPSTGAPDMNIPRDLQRGFKHTDMGVYATVISGGTVSLGDTVT